MEIQPYPHNVKYYETDQMAVVHHSNYIRWFEEARIDWMRQVGIDYREIEARGFVVPVVGVSAKYHSMTRFADNVLVYVTLIYYNSVRFRFRYEVRDAETGQLRTTGESDHCVLNEKGQVARLRRMAPDLHAIFAAQMEKSAQKKTK